MKQQLNFSRHSVEQLKNRFDLSPEFIQDILPILKEGTENTNFVVKNKLRRYPTQRALVHKGLNLLLMVDKTSEVVTTAMYLDGKWGY